MRFALLNLERCIGITKGYWQYLTSSWKFLWPHDSLVLERLGRVLRSLSIDVIAFTEIDGGSPATRGVNQVEKIATLSELAHWAFFPTSTAGGRINQGNGVVSRYPLKKGPNIRLPGFRQPRYVGQAALQIGTDCVEVLVTHLSLEQRFRRHQIPHLAHLIDAAKGHVILAGDFNIKKEREIDLLVESEKLRKVVDSRTYPSWHPTRPLDHIFLSKDLKVVRSYVYDQERFSDHLMTIVDLEITPYTRPLELDPLTEFTKEPKAIE